jgi:hypothetical protein
VLVPLHHAISGRTAVLATARPCRRIGAIGMSIPRATSQSGFEEPGCAVAWRVPTDLHGVGLDRQAIDLCRHWRPLLSASYLGRNNEKRTKDESRRISTALHANVPSWIGRETTIRPKTSLLDDGLVCQYDCPIERRPSAPYVSGATDAMAISSPCHGFGRPCRFARRCPQWIPRIHCGRFFLLMQSVDDFVSQPPYASTQCRTAFLC